MGQFALRIRLMRLVFRIDVASVSGWAARGSVGVRFTLVFRMNSVMSFRPNLIAVVKGVSRVLAGPGVSELRGAPVLIKR